MPFSTGARHGLAYVAESTFGTTPGTPTMLNLRHTSASPNLVKTGLVSQEIRSDREIIDARHGVQRVQGQIGFELSYGAFDAWLEAACFGAFSTDVLKGGTTLKSFTLESRHTDIAQYRAFTGVVVDQMSLTIRPDAIVTGTFDILGQDMGISGTTLDASPDDVATNLPFDSFQGSINEGGSSIAIVTGLDINLQNGITPAYVIGSAQTPQMIPSRRNITGTVTAYFENATLLNKFINETESSIDVTLTDAAGNDLTIDLPRIKYMGGEVPVNGEGEIILSLPFQALRDSTEATSIKITRAAA